MKAFFLFLFFQLHLACDKTCPVIIIYRDYLPVFVVQY